MSDILDTMNAKGLTQTAAVAHLAADGPNELSADQRRSLWVLVFEVVREPMFLLLLGAGGIYLAMGSAHEALMLLGFVFIIMGVTILQERRTENALDALRDLSSPRALVVRDGRPIRIAGREVVREDIVLLSEGDRIPADGKVLKASELSVDESMLTGESVSVSKFADQDVLFAGTLVVRGQGAMQVTAIGRHTELGRIGKSLQGIDIESSPLRNEIGRLTQRLAIAGVALCAVLSLIYWLLRGNALDAVLAGITLAMGVLPQEFPVIMIVFLALGARRIARQNVLTRRLNSIETLGQTTVLCVDKTGTLTQNRMSVSMLVVAGQHIDVSNFDISKNGQTALPEQYHELMEYLVLASEIEPFDPMEQAFHRFAGDYLANTEHLHPDWSLVREYELSPEQLAMSHLWRDNTGRQDVVATKGSPEAIADLCHLNAADAAALNKQAELLAERGLRVLAVAKAQHNAKQAWPAVQHDFDFQLVGLVGLADPLRPEVPAAIAECQRAGIRVVMITGDHPRTARAIGALAGLAGAVHGEKVLTGAELAALPPESLAASIADVNVFARVTPQQKLQIVEALKSRGEIVAMTGDGVNDAPALKAAHIGIAMGKRGTDVAREAASLVLLEDDFTAIVAAIKLGRRVFSNLRQALIYTLAVHIPIIGLSILPLLFGLPLALMPIHIAFLELVIDPACSIVFEAEEGDADPMQFPPRPASEAMISTRQVWMSLVQGGLATLMVIGFYQALLNAGVLAEITRGLVFVALVTANSVLILPARAAHMPWAHLFRGLSRVTVIVFACTFTGLLAVTSIAPVAAAFGFQPAGLKLWLLAFAAGLAMVLVFQSIARCRVFTQPAQS